MLNLRSVLLALCLVLFGSLYFFTPSAIAEGTGTMTFEQRSPTNLLKFWKLQLPNGSVITSGERTKKLIHLEGGSYELTITPHLGATTTISAFNDGVLLASTSGNELIFTLPDDAKALVTVEYGYEGIVEVTSVPSGVTFELRGSESMRLTGTTPATFLHMPPVTYTVYYSSAPGCGVQRPQERELHKDEVLTFSAMLKCGGISGPPPSRPPLSSWRIPGPDPDSPMVRLNQLAHQSEVLPNGTIRFTLSLRNLSSVPLYNLQVTDLYNPASLTITKQLQNDGRVRGNLLVWDVPVLGPGEVWHTVVEGKVRANMSPGERVILMARVQGGNLDDYYAQEVTSMTTVGISVLPQTGSAFDLLFIVCSLGGALLLTHLITFRRRLVSLTA